MKHLFNAYFNQLFSISQTGTTDLIASNFPKIFQRNISKTIIFQDNSRTTLAQHDYPTILNLKKVYFEIIKKTMHITDNNCRQYSWNPLISEGWIEDNDSSRIQEGSNECMNKGNITCPLVIKVAIQSI